MLSPDQENQLEAAGYVLMHSQPGALYQDWVAAVPGREVTFTFAKARTYSQEEIQMACLRVQAYQAAPDIPKPWTRQPTTALAKGYLSEARWRLHDGRWHHEVLGTVGGALLPKMGMALLSKGTQDTLLEMYQAGVAATRLLRELKKQEQAAQDQALKEAEQQEQARQAGAREPMSPTASEPVSVAPPPAPPPASPPAPPSPSSMDQLWRLLGKPDALQELLARAREEQATIKALADEAQAIKTQAEEKLQYARQGVEVAQQVLATAHRLEATAEAKLKTAEAEAAWVLEHLGEAELRMSALATLAGLGKSGLPQTTPVVEALDSMPVAEVVPTPVDEPPPEVVPEPVAEVVPEPVAGADVHFYLVRQTTVTGRKPTPEGLAMDRFLTKAGADGVSLADVMQHLRVQGLDHARGLRTFRDRIRYGIYKAVGC